MTDFINEDSQSPSGLPFGPVFLNPSTPYPNGFWDLIDCSTAVRKQLTEEGTYTIRTSYEPTNWDYTMSEKKFWDGLPIDSPACPVCFMHRTITGACSIDCPGDPNNHR